VKDEKTKIILPDELAKRLSPEEASWFQRPESVDRDKLRRLFKTHLAPSCDEMRDVLSGAFDLCAMRLEYFRSYSPSLTARRSFLYLQEIARVSFGPGYYTLREGLASYLLARTISGAGRLVYEGAVYELAPGDVFLIDCSKPHEYRAASSEGWGYDMLHFNGCAMPDYFAPILEGGVVVFSFTEDSGFVSLLRELFETSGSEGANLEMLVNCILVRLVTELLKAVPNYRRTELPDYLRQARAYLGDHCRERLSLDEIAARVGVSKYHLCHEFKRYTGETVFDFIADARMSVAKRLLRYTETPISAIAEGLGFEDQSGFYHLFRKKEGTTPLAYRRQWKGSKLRP
jgi:AraC-type DNA-binding domain-containing proteins